MSTRPDLTANDSLPILFPTPAPASIAPATARAGVPMAASNSRACRWQLKIRGFRVEPGEIAAAFSIIPPLASGRGSRRSQTGQALRLVAYVVPRERPAGSRTADLRSFLAGRLPDYMVPAALRRHREIPLNRNGKLDEKALPSPDLREGEFVAPRTPTEETLARFFAEVFGLGIAAAPPITSSNSAVIRCSPPRWYQDCATGESAYLCAPSSNRPRWNPLPVVSTVSPCALPCHAAITPQAAARQSSAVFLARTNLVCRSVCKQTPATTSLSRSNCTDIWTSGPRKARSNGLSPGTRPCARASSRATNIRSRKFSIPPASLNVPLISLPYTESDSALKESLASIAKHRFDLANDAPFLARLFILEPNRYVLSIVIHHVAFDGWSAGIFLNEFTALYTAFSMRRPDPLPRPVIQYADFSIWQRQQDWDADLAYLAGRTARRARQSGTARPGIADAETVRLPSVLPISLDATLHAELLKLANENGASLFMVLHAAFASLLARWSGQDDVVIGTVTANRNRSELESIIGCFVNTLALRTKFEAGESFTSLLGRVKTRRFGRVRPSRSPV